MKLSYTILKTFVSGLEKYEPARVAEILTEYSFETIIHREFTLDPTIIVVRIEAVEPHPNADRLRLATVTDGTATIRVVCGAPNIMPGQVVPFSPPGANVLDKDGQLYELGIAKIRGVESPGMLNSRRELGLGSDHDGIFVLPADTPLGSRLTDHIPNDTIFEADITPNRAHDCLSHLGVARELVLSLKGQVSLREPNYAALPNHALTECALDITNEKVERYMGIGIEGITNGISPLWLQACLLMLDQKPINALVDISNYVMLEIGNPSHAFDAQKLPGKTMSVREAKEEETVELLDGTSQIAPHTLLITADDVGVAVAGIMGGKATEVTTDTTSILLEVATFDAYTIQQTALAMNMRTEAATRFLKGIDPNLVQQAATRLLYLIQDITGGVATGMLDYYPRPRVPEAISFRPEKVARIAGLEEGRIPHDTMREVLRGIGCAVKEEGNIWHVTPPSMRLDLQAEHDLVEEIIFQSGLQDIHSATLPTDAGPKAISHSVFVRESMRNMLSNKGFTETYGYSFEEERVASFFNFPQSRLVIANPMAPNLSNLRVSLLPNLVSVLVKNKAEVLRRNIVTERSVFEIGHVYYLADDTSVHEEERVAGLSVVQCLEAIKELLQNINVQYVSYKPVEDTNVWKKGSEEIYIAKKRIGTVGELQEGITKQAKIRVPVYGFEMQLSALTEAIPQEVTQSFSLETAEEVVRFEELNKYPSVYRDISLLVEADTPVEKVKEVIERAGGELVVDTDLFDEYEPDDEGVNAKGRKKSLSFHIEYQAKDRTLAEAEITPIEERIKQAVQEELDAKVR